MFEYSQSISKYFVEHTELLKKYFGITHFMHFRLYHDREYFIAGSDFAFIKKYSLAIKESELFFGEFLHSNDDDFQLILWPKVPTHYSMDFYIKHGYWNGLTLIQKKENGFVGWAMLTDVDNVGINNIYVKHSDALINFVRYFNSRFSDLLCFRENLPKFDKNLNLDKINACLSPNSDQGKIDAFYSELNCKKSKILNANKELVTLTPREIDCLRQLSSGKTQKEIAYALDLSPRTVESYLKNIKYKTCVDNKSKLIDLYNANFIPTNRCFYL